MLKLFMQNQIINSVYVNIDGACKNNPGPAAIAIVIKAGRNVLEEFSEAIGDSTNNFAEYRAAVKALELAAKYCRNRVYIFTDSELLVNQLTGRYRIRSKKLLDAIKEIKLLELLFKKVSYYHVSREKNRRANDLVNKVFGQNI